ncbi:MAG: 2Fe-2S iron-sulfur cluster-binding protein [Anaerolineae bacterium]
MPILKIIDENKQTSIEIDSGANLREVLLEYGFSPYTRLTHIVNCGGRGICATCGVWIDTGEQQPQHWHDKLASRFGYPRLSCQINVTNDMTVRLLTDKIIWGGRDHERADQLQP